MEVFEKALQQVEREAAGVLPDHYRNWLRKHRRRSSQDRRTPFDLDELLQTQRLVQDVLPAGTLAVGDDGYGNLMLLRFSNGAIEWWDHEREFGDDRTEFVASSFEAFLEQLGAGES